MEFIEVIRCPACGKKEKIKSRKQYCSSCGCYLPPLLKEKEEIYQHPYSYFPSNYTDETIMYNNLHSTTNTSSFNNWVKMQSELTNVANTVNYEMEKLRSQINADYIQLSQSMQTQYILNSLGRFNTVPIMPTKNHYD